MFNNKIKLLYCLILLCPLLASCSSKVPQENAYVVVASVSTDGNYAITTNAHFDAVLWNLKSKTYKIISTDANRYSAYFIKNTHDFLYQNASTKEVYVMDTNGTVIKHFNPDFSTYGQAMTSDLNTYIAVDQNDQVFIIKDDQKTQLLWHWCGPNYKDETPAPTGKPYTCGSFIGDGKLFNINLSNDDKYFTTSGFSEIYIWNLREQKPISHSTQNDAQTFATISSDSRFIISGDSNAHAFLFNLANGNAKRLDFTYNSNTKQNFDSEAAVSDINDWSPNDWIGRTTAIKFIDSTHYLVIFNMASGFMDGGFHYAGLFSLNEPKAIKYLNLLIPDLNNQPYPATQDYARDQATDTSSSAHILVMGQQNGNGILVYQYDPKTQTLKQVWAPTIQ